jgi:hypothetical protein
MLTRHEDNPTTLFTFRSMADILGNIAEGFERGDEEMPNM